MENQHKHHTYKDTIEAAKDIDIDEPRKAEFERPISDVAYMALAASASMGFFGQEQEAVELINLALAQELAEAADINRDKKIENSD